MTVAEDGMSFDLTLPGDPRAATQARHSIDVIEGRAHPETLAKARLLITEMVASAVAGPPSPEVRVHMGISDGVLRGEVAVKRAAAHRPRGWGLLLVRRIASRWGTDGGALWFEVDDR